jgi:aspartyl-tRNA(Asn)/glutamyl-tRNA(Gln) amidotransferase subunit B
VSILEFQTVIGLEVHAQVLTASKMFSSCPVPDSSSPPNSTVDPVSLGLPGSLPTVNRSAIEKTIMTGLALGSEIPRATRFDRKNYMYPDLMKGYQISQYELPLAVGGELEFEHDGAVNRVGITRVHLEEDTARLTHVETPSGTHSLVDVNRAGVPLMEIVSDPDMTSPAQARAYLMTLRQILRFIGASTGNMDEGAFRVDANVSVRATDGSFVGPKVEVKNMNSFRSVERALEYEVRRQKAAVGSGDELVQETRGWIEDRQVTVSQRTKEYAEDYRYFPEPDLPPLEVHESWVAAIRAEMAELPMQKLERFISEYELQRSDALVLTSEPDVADYFEEVVKLSNENSAESAKWVMGEVFAIARTSGGIKDAGVDPSIVAESIRLVADGVITRRTAKEVFVESVETGSAPSEIVEARGLAQVSDQDLISQIADEVVEENPAALEDFLAGKQQVIGFLIGQSMRKLKGAGNPDVVRTELIRALEARRNR